MTAAIRLWSPESDPQRGGPGGDLSPDMRLSEIYWAHIEPVHQLAKDAAPRNLEALRCSLAYWQRFTGDPPLNAIHQVQHGLEFVAGLRTLPGKRSPSMSANCIAKHVAAIQAMLDLCGPPDRSRREALDLLERVPFLQKPKRTKKPPEDCYSLAEIELLLANAGRAQCPDKLSIDAGEYMRRLYLLAFNTGMRVQEMCLVRWEHDRADFLDLPPRIVAKGSEGRRVELNQFARGIVDSMRGVHRRGETFARIFPWPWNWAASRGQLYDQHTLVRECLPDHRRQFLAFHAFRKATANELVKINAMGCQKQLGHATAKMTGDHYVSRTAAKDAVARLPQPKWRLDRQARLFD